MPDTADISSAELETSAPLADTGVDTSSAPAPTPDDNTPPPSSGDGGSADDPRQDDEPQSMADAIAEALEKAPEGEAPATDDPSKVSEDADDPDAAEPKKSEDAAGGEADKDEQGKDPNADSAESDEDPTDDELAGMSRNAQKRIAKLLSQRKEARTDAETLRPDAQRYQSVRRFMSENNLVDQEVADLFKAGADLKSGDPKRLQAFLATVQPLVQSALEATGQAIPADLRTQVETGEMTEQAAHEVAVSRHAATRAQAQAARVQAQDQTREVAETQGKVLEAVNQWSAQVRQTDPEFDLKADALRRVSQAIVAERGLPKTPEQAVQYAQEAYNEASQMLSRVRPAPKPTRPTPSADSSSKRSGVQPEPSTLADVIGNALNG